MGVILTLAAILLTISLYSFVWVPFQRRARMYDVMSCCLANLRTIDQAMKKYHEAFGTMPEPAFSWEDLLLSQHLITANQLTCCVRKDVAFHFKYVPFPANRLEAPKDQIWFYEPFEAHWKMGAYILFADGHAQSLKPAEYTAALQRAGIPLE